MFWIIVVLLIAFAALWLFREFSYYGLGLGVSSRLAYQGKRYASIKILRKMLARKSIVGRAIRGTIYLRLTWMLLSEKQFDECIEECEAFLREIKNSALVSMVRTRMADAHEAAGRTDDAEAQRNLAASDLQEGPENPTTLLAKAQGLTRSQKYPEAIELLQRALELGGKRSPHLRATLLCNLSNCAFNAGRMHEAADWAEEAANAGGDVKITALANKSAGTAFGSLGDLEKSERFYQQTVDLQKKMGDREGAGQTMAALAGITRKRGYLTEAIGLCDEAATQSLTAKRMARMQQYECLMALGRYDEARQMLEISMKSNSLAVPVFEKRVQGLSYVGHANIHLSKREPSEAIPYLDQAADHYSTDPKLTRMVKSYRVWALGQLGDSDVVENLTAELEESLTTFPDDRSGSLSCNHFLARAWMELKEPEKALGYLDRYVALGPDPVDIPKYRYLKAECLKMLGRTEDARIEYQAAVDCGIETYYSAQAKLRLSELQAGEAKE
ncbi:MAG: tetratricopeptide repeat protein [Chthonomonadales bacterium]